MNLFKQPTLLRNILRKKVLHTFFLLLLPLLGFSNPVQIDLSTKSNEENIFLLFRYESPSVGSRYVKEMEKIIAFDFNHTGFTKSSIFSDQKKNLDRPYFKAIGAHYVARSIIKKNKLHIEILNIKSGVVHRYRPLTLKGNLSKDRQLVHKHISEIGHELFGKRGIQDRTIIYSLRVKNRDRSGSEWASEIWMCDYDGANARQITNNKSYATTPKFLPKGNGFIYVSFESGQPKIKRATTQDPKGKVLVDLRGSQALPSISARGHYISFISDAAGRPDLFLYSLKEKNKKPIQLFSYPKATQATSTFSPDAEHIAFVSDKDGPPRIYLVEIPATSRFKRPTPTLLTKKNRTSSSPSWSPDGKKIAYSAKTNGIRQIWVYDVESAEEWQITHGKKNMENPSWAPDSIHLIVNSEDDFISELYMINYKRNDPIKISEGKGDKRFPSFENYEEQYL